MTASEVVQQIVGTHIEDDRTPKPPLLEWIQAECRTGCFRQAIEKCANAQVEPLRVDLTLVEKVEPDKIAVRIPCRIADHESSSTFQMDVCFELNPLTLSVHRV